MFEESTVRKRGRSLGGYARFNVADGLRHDSLNWQSLRLHPAVLIIGLSIGFFLLCSICKFVDDRLPDPILIADVADNPGRFIGERAFRQVERLVSLGPRVPGSYENEVQALELLLREIGFIKQFAHPVHTIEVDVQRPSGVMTPSKQDGVNTIYDKVGNIVVRISAGGNTTDVKHLLVNAHFDTVPGSPGASDDGVSVAVALEVLEVLSRRMKALEHPVVFLFNGAEEKGLLGSHGFITQHHWAKKIGAFINLDACGAGGREIVFQAGPQNAWLMKAYSAVVPYPFANIVAQEIFEARYIPSDTDFKIFRDYGHISGLDLAYIRNGFVYHTKYDDLNHLSLPAMQRAGDNLLALVTHLADSDWPTDLTESNLIFFDYLGVFMVTFSNVWWHVLNIVLIALAFHQSKVWVTTNDSELRTGGICKQVILSSLACIFQMLGAFLAAYIVVICVTITGSAMSWFSRPWLLFALYGLPALTVALFLSLWVSVSQKKHLGCPLLVERVQFEATKLNLALIVLLTYMFGIKSNVILLIWLLCAIAGRWFLDRVYRHKAIDGVWLIVHFLTFSIALLETLYLSDSLLSVLVPVSGRNGLNTNPDLLIAMVTVALTLLVFAFTLPLLSLIRNGHRVLVILVALHALIVLGVIFTPFGFPYSAEETKPQRVQILHVERKFHGSNGLVKQRDSGYWLFGWDFHIKGQLLEHIESQDTPVAIDESQCQSLPYCGVPYYFPSLKRIRSSYWLPAPQPVIYKTVQLELIDQKIKGINLRSYTFSLTGPDHMGLLIWPVKGVELVGWSPSGTLPYADTYYKERPLYFVSYFYGVHPTKPYEFTLTLKVPPSLNGKSVLEISVTGHILHGPERMSSELASALNKFPPWTYAHGWTASYSHWSY